MGVAVQQEEALKQLAELAPGVPLLGLGQTVFWDEPMKAGVVAALRESGDTRDFVAGVHDTDYFAKFASKARKSGYDALPHNDTTTKGFWSAAGEFSALFGSETVVSLKILAEAGAKVSMVSAARPGVLDEMTEAWGWRGVVSRNKEQQVTADKRLAVILPKLFETFEWALDSSLDSVAHVNRPEAETRREEAVSMTCDTANLDSEATLADWYEALLPKMYDWVSGQRLNVETTRTSNLLKLNRNTCSLPRFNIINFFLNPDTSEKAKHDYDVCLKGSEIYTLDRFGVGALPFDLVIPGVGRGTLRLGSAGGLVMCPKPLGFSYKTPPKNVAELAALIENRFGPNCVLVGKAVTLIGMLASEFVFVFHAGASGYTSRSKALHQALGHKVNPILRVSYEPWDAFGGCETWIRLPEPFRRAFGCDEMSSETFAKSWRCVVEKEARRLKEMAALTQTRDLIGYLKSAIAGPWESLAEEYAFIHDHLVELQFRVLESRNQRRIIVEEVRSLNQKRDALQHQRGEHWRTKLFQKTQSAEELAKRQSLIEEEKMLHQQIRLSWANWRELKKLQDDFCDSLEAQSLKKRRGEIALEAELMRIRLIRESVIVSVGLPKAGHRPAAWWFPLICPSNNWFEQTVLTAKYEVEPLC